MSDVRRQVPANRYPSDDDMTGQRGCDSVEIWRAKARTAPSGRARSASMDLDTVTYVFQSPEGTFSIKPRLSRRWRVKHDSSPWGDSFASAEEAAQALAREFDVPVNLTEWTEVGDFHTDVGGLLP